MLLLLFAVTACLAFTPEPKLHATNGWVRGARTSGAKQHSVLVAVSRPFERVATLLHEQVGNPDHARFCDYSADVQQLTAPSLRSVSRVQAWAMSSQLKCLPVAGHLDWMQCTASVAQMERALSCTFYDYTHPHAPGVVLARAESYRLPMSLAGHVDLVAGVKRLPRLPAPKKIQRKTRQSGVVTPARSRQLWHVSAKGGRDNGNLQEVAQFLGQYMTPSDLTTFWADFNLPPVNVTIVGPNDPANPGAEASLDIQTITGVNQGTSTQFTVTPGLHSGQEPFLVWLLAIAGAPRSPFVHSVSYGDDEDSLDGSYMTRVDQEFAKLGLKGHTFVFASGDSGVDCKTGNRQSPDFPASSPHVITVGGVVDDGQAVPRSWSGSGGGFSDFFPQPTFMQIAHRGYLNNPANNIPPRSSFNQTGRGYPDVAAVAMNVAIVMGGQQFTVGGTSCAAPAVSAILSLLNDVRIALKKPVLGYGFLPLFYRSSSASGFLTIVRGPANTAGACQGFQPAANGGWSAITGFGGFNTDAMTGIVARLN